MEQKAAPEEHRPGRLRQVQDAGYGLAVENVIARTGFSHEEAERLVCAVLAPLFLAPKELPPKPSTGWPGEDVLNVCEWAYVTRSGEVVYCDSGDQTESDGTSVPHDDTVPEGDHHAEYVCMSWVESDPRAVHLPTWKGEGA